jgi:hypothetical protein
MWLLRLLGIVTLIVVILGFAAYVLTRNPVYLHFSWRVFRYAAMAALLVFALLFLERVAVIPV